jgi:hypothetical protein
MTTTTLIRQREERAMRTHSKNLMLSISAVLFGAMLAACGAPASTTPSGLISGQVLGLTSPAGVAVSVVGSEHSVLTDDSGEFRLARFSEDNLRLRFARGSDDISSELELSREHGNLAVKVRLSHHQAELVEVEHQDLNEFEGAVASLDRAAMKLTLAGGRVIGLEAKTVFDPKGDLFSLDSLEAALKSSAVRAEGFGPLQSGRLVASLIKVEVEGAELEPGDDKGKGLEPGDHKGQSAQPADDKGSK